MAGANFIVTILNPNKTPAFNYTALKYFSQLIATGENKINLIFETDSPRESPQPRIPAASERGTTSQRLAWCWVSRFYQRPLHTAHPWPSMGRKIKRGRSLCGSNWCHMFILLNEAWFLGTGGSLDIGPRRGRLKDQRGALSDSADISQGSGPWDIHPQLTCRRHIEAVYFCLHLGSCPCIYFPGS